MLGQSWYKTMILEHSQFKITKQINLRNETKLEFCSEKENNFNKT